MDSKALGNPFYAKDSIIKIGQAKPWADCGYEISEVKSTCHHGAYSKPGTHCWGALQGALAVLIITVLS